MRIEGLARGSYRIRYGTTGRTQAVSETLELSLLIDEAKRIRISQADED